MFLTVSDYLTANAALTSNLPNFSTNLTVFQNTTVQIQGASAQQNLNRSGPSTSKKKNRSQAILLSSDNSGKLDTFAKFTNNATLEAEVKITDSELKRMSDTKLKDFAQTLYARAQTHLTSLANYGISTTTQANFLNAINAFSTSMAHPRIAVTNKEQITKMIPTYFKTAKAALKNMDAAIKILKLSQPAFYAGYWIARKPINTSVRSLALKALVTDAATSEPIKGVKAVFVAEGDAKQKTAVITKKTAKRGRFNMRSLKAGTYKVTLTKEGYASYETIVYVSDSETAEL